MRRFLSLILAFTFVMSIFVRVAFASDYTSVPVSLWDKYLKMSTDQLHGSTIGAEDWPFCIDLESLVGSLTGRMSANLCESSDDHLHHSDHLTGESGEDSNGYYSLAVCKNCGDTFKVYGEDLHDAYDNYLTDNNLNNGLSSDPDGGLIWYPTVSDLSTSSSSSFSFFYRYSQNGNTYNQSFNVYLDRLPYTNTGNAGFSVYSDYSSTSSFRSRVTVFSDSKEFYRYYCSLSFSVPLSGSYILFSSLDSISSFNSVTSSFQSCHVNKGSWFSFSFSSSDSYVVAPDASFVQSVSFPAFRIIPDSFDSTFTVPTTINVNNNDYSVRNFNFSTRTYNVTNENGDDITITYGDNEYTVTNNTTNITNNYYYYITNEIGEPGGGSSGSGIDYTNILTQIRDLVSQILDKIGVGDGSGVAIPAEQLPEEVNDPEKLPDWFSTLVSKFLWINDLYQITYQLFSDITNDALSADAVHEGIIPASALSTGHAGDGNAGGESSEEVSEVQAASTEETVSERPMLASATVPGVSLNFPEMDFYGFQFGGYQIMDFSWYAPYKHDVDNLLSGFMLLAFVVWVFHRAPEIIRGGAATQSTLGKFESYNEGFVDPSSRWFS